MDKAIKAWRDECDLGRTSNEAGEASTGPLKLSYVVYGCMLLLPANSFQSPAWQETRERCTPGELERLYQSIARHLKVTHIAINKPIPALHDKHQSQNVLRAPNNFTPLYGDFGPSTCGSPPTREDFESAFWVTAKQNEIFQTWAPRWTMFSRGNISEKARLLNLPSVKDAVEQGKGDNRGCAAVDLYAGIGYFAFSYLRAGVDRVLCWDLNAWSIEGLRRGAAANKWSTAIYAENEDFPDPLATSKARLLVFHESNEHAAWRILQLKCPLPPIRHVNCGLLPTSRGSWQTALNIVDRDMGGWLHIHENFAVHEIEQKAEDVLVTLQAMLGYEGSACEVKVEYVNRLKSYAPGVMHCVLDIYVPPIHRS